MKYLKETSKQQIFLKSYNSFYEHFINGFLSIQKGDSKVRFFGQAVLYNGPQWTD